MADIVGLITARGGSKGIPNKNIVPIAGRPLIAWTIQAALQSRHLDHVIVSTDDENIAAVAETWGASVPFRRPAELSGDRTPHILAVEHAIRWLDEHDRAPEYVLLLQPTSPLRTGNDIDEAVALALASNAPAVVSVSDATHAHPYLMRRLDEHGALTPFVTVDIEYLRRQDLPQAYFLNGAIYLNRRDSLLRDRTFTPPGTLPYVMPEERSLQIDSSWDLYLIELILERRLRVSDEAILDAHTRRGPTGREKQERRSRT